MLATLDYQQLLVVDNNWKKSSLIHEKIDDEIVLMHKYRYKMDSKNNSIKEQIINLHLRQSLYNKKRQLNY
jgi:hypothetical protein